MCYDPTHSARWIAAMARRFVIDESGSVPMVSNPILRFISADADLMIEVTNDSVSPSPELTALHPNVVVAASFIEAQPHLERFGFVRGLG